ncbi:MAG TPA: hypothetical protein VNV43_03450 [Candidatus Acidoferrales bacterium]|jgi:hypothetical protein|nr:hypothetical protein [Candidatus Acidoferrales bacterium]
MNEKTDNTKSIQPSRVARWRRWHLKSRIFLMLLAVVAIVVYLVPAGSANEFKGIGAALCVLACGGFLIWHAIHFFAEQDKVDEKVYPEEFPEQNSQKKEI